MNTEYKDKYLKYKSKYLTLKSQIAGGVCDDYIDDETDQNDKGFPCPISKEECETGGMDLTNYRYHDGNLCDNICPSGMEPYWAKGLDDLQDGYGNPKTGDLQVKCYTKEKKKKMDEELEKRRAKVI